MERRTLAALILLTQSCVLRAAAGAVHNTSEPADSAVAHLLFPSTAAELAFARRQLYAASALLPNVALRPGTPPVACSCAEFAAGTCFAAGCHPCEPACGAPPHRARCAPGAARLARGCSARPAAASRAAGTQRRRRTRPARCRRAGVQSDPGAQRLACRAYGQLTALLQRRMRRASAGAARRLLNSLQNAKAPDLLRTLLQEEAGLRVCCECGVPSSWRSQSAGVEWHLRFSATQRPRTAQEVLLGSMMTC